MTSIDEQLDAQVASSSGGHVRPEPKRQKNGRYLTADPDGGPKEKSWTRATTFAKSTAEMSGITKWEKRLVLYGASQRPALVAQAGTIIDLDDPDSKRKLNGWADECKEAARGSEKSNFGTAMHAYVEQVEMGLRAVSDVPPAYRADVEAYFAALAEHHLTVLPEYVERVVVVPELGVAGTFDNVLDHPELDLVISDKKTGAKLDYAWREIAIQLALYAHAHAIWDVATESWLEMPAVNQDVALVAHLPVGEGRCDLYTVDIAAGWEAAKLSGAVREWRRAKVSEPLHLPAARADETGMPDQRTPETGSGELW